MQSSGAPIVEDFRFSSPPIDLLGNFYFYLAVLVGGLFVYWLIRRGIRLRAKTKEQSERMKPKRDAIAGLKAAHAGWKKDRDTERYSLRLTMVIRQFLEDALGPNCSKQTATQFLRCIKTLRLVEDDEKMWLNLMIQKCELAKFADQKLGDKEIGAFHQRGLMLVNEVAARREAEFQMEQERLEEQRKEAKKQAKQQAKEQRKAARAADREREKKEKEARKKQEEKKKREGEKEKAKADAETKDEKEEDLQPA